MNYHCFYMLFVAPPEVCNVSISICIMHHHQMDACIIIVSICMHLMFKIQIEWTCCLFSHQVLFLFMTDFKEQYANNQSCDYFLGPFRILRNTNWGIQEHFIISTRPIVMNWMVLVMLKSILQQEGKWMQWESVLKNKYVLFEQLRVMKYHVKRLCVVKIQTVYCTESFVFFRM